MNEFELIDKIKQLTYKQRSVIKGIGDDAAVFRPSIHDVVTAVDTFVDNVHFSSKTTMPFHIGYRSLAANISDIAAMGADPKFYLVSLVVPSTIDDSTILDIYQGMNELANDYKMDLIGGDTVSGSQLVISITVFGYVLPNQVRYRSDAKRDDIVFVTGTLGDARAGLEILLHDLEIENESYFIDRHQMPKPRVDFVNQLHHIKRMALNDITDGIANELFEIGDASDVDIIINDASIPVHHSFHRFSDKEQHNWKYFGGEDFELVGTVSAAKWQELEKVAQQLEMKVSKIGKVYPKQNHHSQVLLQKKNQVIPLKRKGYIHLSR